MTPPRQRPPWLVAALTLALLASARGGAPAASVEIAWNAERARVELAGLPPETLAALGSAEADRDGWSALLTLAVAATADRTATPMLGRVAVEGETLVFAPRFPLRPGLVYAATFDPAAVGLPGERVEVTIALPAERPSPRAVVAAVFPSGPSLPANLLKFYVHFTQPMARGDQYRHVRIVDAEGRPVPDAFLELPEELWDADGRRLTLLFDPGRIKRGLKPHDEVGYALLPGRDYALIIDAGWPDAHGQPLAGAFRHEFHVADLDHVQPSPKAWRLQPPRAATLRPLIVQFDEPLDHALAERLIAVRDAAGGELAGAGAIDEQETRWRFRPAAPWTPGRYALVVDAALEDRAGNSVGRPFETEATDQVGAAAEEEPVILPFDVE